MSEKNINRTPESLNFDPEILTRVGSDLVELSLNIKPSDHLFIQLYPGATQLAEIVKNHAEARGASVSSEVLDKPKLASVAKGSLDNLNQQLPQLIQPHLTGMQKATKVAILEAVENLDPWENVPQNNLHRVDELYEPIQTLRKDLPYVIFSLPTPQEAAFDQMDYQTYVDMVFNACDRDWLAIRKAQQILIQKLQTGKKIDILSGISGGLGETELSMNIDGMIFASQTTHVNFPGSEVFAAPNRYSLNGILTVPHKVRFPWGNLKNLRLKFQGGKVFDVYTSGPKKDQDRLESTLLVPDGPNEVGEFAFGTNSAIYYPTLNPSYIEKISGSFHIALGWAHPYTEFEGKICKVNNGVTGDYHIDLPRLMLKEYGGGIVLLDGEVIQADGNFVDPALQILNPLQ